MTPSWLLDLLAAALLAVVVASMVRALMIPLATAGPWRPMRVAADADVAHALTGIALAGLLTPSLAMLPNAAWRVIFGLATAWFAGRAWLQARRGGIGELLASRCPLSLIHCAALLYMFLALSAAAPGGGGMAGTSMGGPAAMGTLQYPTLAEAFTLVLIGCSAWDLDQLSGRRFRLAVAAGPATGAVASGPRPAARAFLLAPATQVSWQVVLGLAMALMLVIMI
jgi:hypothetical protein